LAPGPPAAQVLQGAATACEGWWQKLSQAADASVSCQVSQDVAESAVRWCLLVTALAPQLRVLPQGRQLLQVCLVLVANSSHWPPSVREAALEPWSVFLCGDDETEPLDPRRGMPSNGCHPSSDVQISCIGCCNVSASPCGGGCFSIEHLQVDLTRALALGLRFRSAKGDVGGNDAFEACERLRDRAVALLTEWRMATRKDAVPAAIQDSLGPAGCREWAATEAAL
ncbi:unnamed protein product, partial [Polarella glacialis]